MCKDLRTKVKLNKGKIKLVGHAIDRRVYLFDKELDLSESKKEAQFTDQGFNWGYTGKGCKQLTLSLLLELGDIVPQLPNVFIDLLNTVVGILPQGSFEVRIDILRWVSIYANKVQDGDAYPKPVHPYSLMEFKLLDTFYSKFLDFPNNDIKSGVFDIETIEYDLLNKFEALGPEMTKLHHYIKTESSRPILGTPGKYASANLSSPDVTCSAYVYRAGMGSNDVSGHNSKQYKL